jgi:hypothetical protein
LKERLTMKDDDNPMRLSPDRGGRVPARRLDLAAWRDH